jgi:hypothetical protein
MKITLPCLRRFDNVLAPFRSEYGFAHSYEFTRGPVPGGFRRESSMQVIWKWSFLVFTAFGCDLQSVVKKSKKDRLKPVLHKSNVTVTNQLREKNR